MMARMTARQDVRGGFPGADARLTGPWAALAVAGVLLSSLTACGGGGYGRLSGTPYVADITPTVSRPAFARAPGAEAPGAAAPEGGVRSADDLVDDVLTGGPTMDDDVIEEDMPGVETDLASPTPME